MKNEQIISHLCTLLEQKTYWGPIDTWTDKNFKRLSTEIAKVSDIVVSSATIKRITGKVRTQDDYHPQEASLDGICIYLGYESWEDFRQALLKSELSETIESEYVARENTKINTKAKSKKRLVIKAGLVLAGLFIAGILYYVSPGYFTRIAANEIAYQQPTSFYYSIPKGEPSTPPFRVTLHSDIQPFVKYSDPLKFILYKGNIIPLYNSRVGKSTIEVKNYGVHLAKLFVENKMIAQTSILAASPGWYYRSGDTIAPAVISNGSLRTYTKNSSADSSLQRYTAEWYGETGVPGAGFSLETVFNSIPPSLPGREDILLSIHTQFNKFNIELIGEKTGAVPFIKFGDSVYDVKIEGYNQFRANLEGKHKLLINHYNAKVDIILDDKLIHSGASSGIFGEIQGFSIGSRTGVEVDYIKMKSFEVNF